MVFKTILIGAQLLTLKIAICTNNTVVLWAYWFALHLLGIHTALSALNGLRGQIVVVLSAQIKMQVSIDAVYSCLTGQVILSASRAMNWCRNGTIWFNFCAIKNHRI